MSWVVAIGRKDFSLNLTTKTMIIKRVNYTMQQFADEYVHFLARFGSDQVGRPTILNYL